MSKIINPRARHASECYVRDNNTGVKLFEGSEIACRDYAEDKETGIIPCHLSIVPVN